MGRDCGWLTAATAQAYRERLSTRPLLAGLGVSSERLDVHAVYVPEVAIDIESEATRLRAVLDRTDCVNIFVSEGAGVKEIVAQMEAEGTPVQRDAFGHVKLDAINPGKYLADTFSAKIGAGKVLVQKSGYFSRAAPANAADRQLIEQTARFAVHMAAQRIYPHSCLLNGAAPPLRRRRAINQPALAAPVGGWAAALSVRVGGNRPQWRSPVACRSQ